MQVEIFTEDSGTTIEPGSVEQIREYFDGNFRSVKTLAREIEEVGDVTIHILSGDYGYLVGSDPVSKLNSSDSNQSQDDFECALLRASTTADIIVILLTQSTFEKIVAPNWENLVSNANKDSIWCLGASESALSSVNIETIRRNIESLILYQRLGVARIDTSTKQDLIDAATNWR